MGFCEAYFDRLAARRTTSASVLCLLCEVISNDPICCCTVMIYQTTYVTSEWLLFACSYSGMNVACGCLKYCMCVCCAAQLKCTFNVRTHISRMVVQVAIGVMLHRDRPEWCMWVKWHARRHSILHCTMTSQHLPFTIAIYHLPFWTTILKSTVSKYHCMG